MISFLLIEQHENIPKNPSSYDYYSLSEYLFFLYYIISLLLKPELNPELILISVHIA